MALQTSDWQNPLAGLLQGLLGQQSNNETNKTSNESTTGTDKTTRTGTTTQTGSTKTTTDADIADLQAVYKRQAAGVTPEMLSAIFTQGQKKLPALTTSYANAVGARSGSNTPLATSISGLQADLTSQAAELNNKLLADSATTAARIADLTKSTNSTSTQTGTTTDSTNLVRDMHTTGGTTQSSDTKNTFDPNALKALGIGAGGLSLLDTLMGGNGTKGGVNDLLGLITGIGGKGGKTGGTGGSGGMVDLITKLFGGNDGIIPKGVGSSPNDSLFEQLFGGSGAGGDDMSWLNDLLGGGGSGPNDSLFDSLFGGGTSDFGGDLGDLFGAFGFADGGHVTEAMGVDNASRQEAMQKLQMLRKVLVLKQLSSTPKGQEMLKKFKEQQDSSKKADGKPPKSWEEYQADQLAFTRKNPVVQPEGIFTHPSQEASGWSNGGDYVAQGKYQNDLIEQNNAWQATMSPDDLARYKAISDARYAAGSKKMKLQFLTTVASMGLAGAGAAGLLGGSGGAGGIGGVFEGMTGTAGSGLGQAINVVGKPMLNGVIQAASDGNADGGLIAGDDEAAENDPNGIDDTIDAKVSVGEYIHPKDVVDGVGVDFLEHLKDRYHVPADMQRAMGMGAAE